MNRRSGTTATALAAAAILMVIPGVAPTAGSVQVDGQALQHRVRQPGRAQGPHLTVTLLGTGCPPPVMTRFGPSILVEAGGQALLFDAGRGASQRLRTLHVAWQEVGGVFLTHLHSDHVVGFPDLWLTGWTVPPGRSAPLHVWGPRGTRHLLDHLERAFEFDIRMRIEDDRLPPEGAAIVAHEIEEGVVYDRGGLKVTAFDVDHAPVTPAFGYRIDYDGRSVVLSGDTRRSDNLVRHAQGVDVIVHEVASAEALARQGVPAERARIVLAHHTTPEQAGEVFARTKPKLAVYSHIVAPDATDEDVIPQTRRTWGGPLELGEDMMAIEVGESIVVRRPGPGPR